MLLVDNFFFFFFGTGLDGKENSIGPSAILFGRRHQSPSNKIFDMSEFNRYRTDDVDYRSATTSQGTETEPHRSRPICTFGSSHDPPCNIPSSLSISVISTFLLSLMSRPVEPFLLLAPPVGTF